MGAAGGGGRPGARRPRAPRAGCSASTSGAPSRTTRWATPWSSPPCRAPTRCAGSASSAGGDPWAGPSPSPRATGPWARSRSSATGSPACSGAGSPRSSSWARTTSPPGAPTTSSRRPSSPARWSPSWACRGSACAWCEGGEPALAPPHSDELGRRVDAEVDRLLDEALGRARAILGARSDLLDALAARLLEVETMSGAELAEMVSTARHRRAARGVVAASGGRRPRPSPAGRRPSRATARRPPGGRGSGRGRAPRPTGPAAVAAHPAARAAGAALGDAPARRAVGVGRAPPGALSPRTGLSRRLTHPLRSYQDVVPAAGQTHYILNPAGRLLLRRRPVPSGPGLSGLGPDGAASRGQLRPTRMAGVSAVQTGAEPSRSRSLVTCFGCDGVRRGGPLEVPELEVAVARLGGRGRSRSVPSGDHAGDAAMVPVTSRSRGPRVPVAASKLATTRSDSVLLGAPFDDRGADHGDLGLGGVQGGLGAVVLRLGQGRAVGALGVVEGFRVQPDLAHLGARDGAGQRGAELAGVAVRGLVVHVEQTAAGERHRADVPAGVVVGPALLGDAGLPARRCCG